MANVDFRVGINAEDAERQLATLHAAIRLPKAAIDQLVQDLDGLAKQLQTVVAVGVAPTTDGLAKLTASFKAPLNDVIQLTAALDQFVQKNARLNESVPGSRERTRIEQEESQKRQAAEEFELQWKIAKTRAALDAFKSVEQQKTQWAKEEAQKRQADDAAQRRLGLAQGAAGSRNAILDEPMLRFLEAQHGGIAGLEQFQERIRALQGALPAMASTIMSHPVQAIRALATDSRSAGAALQFLKTELDFVLQSRFGIIAAGFLVFNVIEQTIVRTTAALVEFERNFGRVRALSAGMANAAQVDAQAQEFLFRTSLATGQSLGELADKYLVAASATSSATQAQALFTNALQFSLATGGDFKESLLALSGVLNLFGDSLGKNLSDQEKLNVLTSMLFTTFKLSRGEANEFVAALNMVGSQANISNVPITELLAVLGGLADKMQEGGRGGRGLAQVLTTIVREAPRINEVFSLGLSQREIIERPLAVAHALRQQIQGGVIDAARFRAEVADLFPQNAQRVFLALMQLTNAELDRYTQKQRESVNIQEAANVALENAATEWERFKRITEVAFAAATGGAETLGGTLKLLNFLAAGVAQATVIIGTVLQLDATLLAGLAAGLANFLTGDFAALKSLPEALSQEVDKLLQRNTTILKQIGEAGLGVDSSMESGRTHVAAMTEAFRSLEEQYGETAQAQARLARGEAGIPATPKQQLELDLAKNLTVEFEKQIGLREDEAKRAEAAFRSAQKTKDQETEHTKAVAALNAVTKAYMDNLKLGDEEIRLRAERITVQYQHQGEVTAEAAAAEITARRGIIAALQGQQAAVEALVAAQKISAIEGERQLLQLARQQQAETKAIREVEALQRRQQDARQKQAEQLYSLEGRIGAAKERVRRAETDYDDERRKTLEEQATRRTQFELTFPTRMTEVLTVQIARLRAAQQTANLPLQERLRLMEAELGLVQRLRNQEAERLDLQIKLGSAFEDVAENERQAALRLLEDPARKAAAEKLAQEQFGSTSDAGVLAVTAKAFGFSALKAQQEHELELQGLKEFQKKKVATAEETALAEKNLRDKQLDAVQDYSKRRIELEKVTEDALDALLAHAQERERERLAQIDIANQALTKLLQERENLLNKHKTEEQHPPTMSDMSMSALSPEVSRLPNGTFTNAPVQRESLGGDQGLPDFSSLVQRISMLSATGVAAPFQDAKEAVRDIEATLLRLEPAIRSAVSRNGQSLIDLIDEQLADRIAQYLAYPTDLTA